MNCEITGYTSSTGEELKVVEPLRNMLNNNEAEVATIMGVFTDPKFSTFLKETHNTEFDITNISNDRLSTLVRQANEYQSKVEWRIVPRLDNTNTRYKIFQTVAAESHAINVLSDMFLEIEDALIKRNVPVNRENIIKYMRSSLHFNHLNKYDAEGKSIPNTKLSKNQIEFTKYIMEQLKNPDSPLLDIIMSNNKVTNLRQTSRLSDTIVVKNTDEAIEETNDILTEDEYKDWNDSTGASRTNDKVISNKVKRVVASIKKLNSVEKVDNANVYDYDNNTYSGLAEGVNYGEVEIAIKTYGKFKNVKEFVESLYDIAKNRPNMMSLIALADKATANEHLANKLYQQFSQPIIDRSEYRADSTSESVKITNTNNKPNIALMNNIFANVYSSVHLNTMPILNLVGDAMDALKGKNITNSITTKDGQTYGNLSTLLVDVFNKLNIGVEGDTIAKYLLYGEGEFADRIASVVEDARLVANLARVIGEKDRANKKLFMQASREWKAARDAAEQQGRGEPDFVQPSNIQLIDTEGNSTILRLSEKYAEYQDVKLELNSRDVNGNLVGDTIKSSFLTKFFQIMEDEVAAKEFLTNKATMEQYQDSNILIETADRPGLLREVNGNYELTPYYKFFSSSLFNGVRNNISRDGADYANMTNYDFGVAGFGMFQNESPDKVYKDINTARYFIQTPSDAPKTFVIRSFRLSIEGLLRGNEVNRSHPIYTALYNIMHQEYLDMRKALSDIVELDESDGLVLLNDPKNKRHGKPIFKKGNFYKNFHTKPDAKGKQVLVDSNWKLVGNVFQFYNLLNNTGKHANPDMTIEGMHKFLFENGFNELILPYIDRYINYNYVEADNKYNKYIDGVKEYTPALAAEYHFNYIIQYGNFNQLFSGNPKFYGSPKDTVKRVKEVQGSGFKYAIPDNASVTVGNKIINIGKTFNYATMTNVVRPSDNVDNIRQRLAEGGTPIELIDFIAAKYLAPAKVDDAQSYITLDEAVRRIYASGDYEEYRSLIESLYDETKPVDISKLNKFIQVNKNFYYDLQYDAEFGMDVPVQIKNSEFVLIPRFLKGTDLEHVAQLMEQHGIDQLNTIETEKAAINKVLTLFDSNTGQITDATLKSFNKGIKEGKKIGNYDSLYKQQDTPQHMDDVNKLGIQIQKKMLDNLRGEDGEATRARIFNLMTSGIEESFDSLMDELGVTKNDDGTIRFNDDGTIYNVDLKTFYGMIARQLASTGADSNMMAYATLNDLTNLPNMPSYMPLIRKKIMSIFQSAFTNHVTRQVFPGFHVPAVAGVGFKKSDIFKASDVTGAPKLKYENGVAEILIPRHKKELWTKYNEDGTVAREFSIEELREAGLDEMIGYRIPTEGKQSIFMMKVVGFLDEAYGSMIVMPDEVVTQSGMDFDIDSIYAMYHNFNIDKNGKLQKVTYDSGENAAQRYISYVNRNLNTEISHLDQAENAASIKGLKLFDDFVELPIEKQNTKQARQNELLDEYIKIMKDPANAEENYMSSNFDDIKAAKQFVFGKTEKFIDINTFEGQAEYRDQVMSGAILKGISVARDGFLSISNVSKTRVARDSGIKITYNLDSNKKLHGKTIEELKSIYDEQNVIDLENNKVLINFTRFGWSLDGNRNIEGKLITPYSAETTALILDGVKEGGLFNMNTYTFNAFKTMIDLGIEFETAIAFLAQPAISVAVAKYNEQNSVFNGDDFNIITSAEREILINWLSKNGVQPKSSRRLKTDDLRKLARNKGLTMPTANIIDKSNMVNYAGENIQNMYDNTELVGYQLGILNEFQKLKTLTDSVDAHARVMNIDKFGAGQSIYAARKMVNDIQTLKADSDNVLYSQAKEGYVSLIDAVYPSLNFSDMDMLTDDKARRSVYPTLYANLKYSTIGSLHITSPMFRTEQSDFVTLKNKLPKNSDEDTIFRFENYIIAKAMNESTFVKSNIFEDIDVTSTDNTGLENRRRISGYTQPIMYDFNFEDFGEDNIGTFMLLSPANKIRLLKNKVKLKSILDYITPQFIDSRNRSEGKSSPHTLTVHNDTVNSEEVYSLFRDMMESDNPYFRIAAEDMIRYAIAVENLRYGYGTVSRIIPAEYLYNDKLNGGLNITNETTQNINKLLATEMPVNTIDDFFAKNSDLPYIVKYENKFRDGKYNILFDSNNVAQLTEESAKLARLVESYGTLQDGKTYPIYKKYIKTNKQGSKETTLYKIQEIGAYIYLTPMNKFERYDIGNVSVNPDNISFARSDIYSQLIKQGIKLPNELSNLDRATYNINRQFVKLSGEETFFNDYLNLVSEYEITSDNIKPPVERNTIVKLDTTKPITEPMAEAILAGIDLNTRYVFRDAKHAGTLISAFENRGYSNYIVVGDNLSSPINTRINTLNNEDKVKIREQRAETLGSTLVSLNESNKAMYNIFITNITNDITNSGFNATLAELGRNYSTITSPVVNAVGLIPDARAKITLADSGGINTDYLVTNTGFARAKTDTAESYKKTAEYLTAPDNVKQLLDNIFKNASKDYGVYLIKIENFDTAVDGEEFYSTIEEVNANVDALISNAAKNKQISLKFGDNRIAKEFLSTYRKLGLATDNKENLNDYTRLAGLQAEAIAVEQMGYYLENKFNNFYTDKDGVKYRADDPKLHDLLIRDNNSTLNNEFTKLLLEINSFAEDENVQALLKYELTDAMSDEERTRMIASNKAIQDIRDNYSNAKNIIARANSASDSYFVKFAKSKSTNLYVINGLYDILKDNMDMSWMSMQLVNAQENSIPLVQLVLSTVKENIFKARMTGQDMADSFENAVKEIQKLFPNTKINDILDDNLKIVREFTDSFLEDNGKLQEQLHDISDKFGNESIEYMDAQNEYRNVFLANNLELEYTPNYYKEKDKVYKILTPYPEFRIALRKIENERAAIRQQATDGDLSNLSDEQHARLEELTYEENYLASIYDREGNIKNTATANQAVNEYRIARDELNSAYHDYNTKAGFDTKLSNVLETINYAERERKGIDKLEEHERYNDARKWLANNVYTTLEKEFNQKLSDAYDTLRVVEPDSNKVVDSMFVNKKDEYGVVDGNKFSDVDINIIRNKSITSQNRQNISKGVVRLIGNRPPVEERSNIYSPEFYNKLRSKAVKPEVRYNKIKEINNIVQMYFNESTGFIDTASMTIKELDTLATLYTELNSIDYGSKDEQFDADGNRIFVDRERALWIRDNVYFLNDEAEYAKQEMEAKTKGSKYYSAWLSANNLEYENKDGSWEFKTNNYIYGYIKPVNEEKYIDKNRGAAKKFLDDNVRYVPTNHYIARNKLELGKGKESYNKWYELNHYFDEFTREWKPLRIWTTREIIDKSKVEYKPKSNWQERSIKPQFQNQKYVEDETTFAKDRANSKYINKKYTDIQNDEGKKQMYDLITGKLNELVLDKHNRRLVKEGVFPYVKGQPKNLTWSERGENALHAAGWYDTHTRSADPGSFEERNVTMPMLHRPMETPLLPMPDKESYDNIDDYLKDVKDIREKNAAIKADNNEFIKKIAEKDFLGVFSKFIKDVNVHNAKQESFNLSRLTLVKLQAMDGLKLGDKGQQYYDAMLGKIRGEKVAATTKMEHQIELFAHNVGKLIFNEFEKDSGLKTKFSKLARNLTSTKFMSLNLTGGMNNVMYGMTQVFMETHGREFLSFTDYMKGLNEYKNGMLSYFSNYNDEHSDNITDALIKLFNVIELDAVVEVATDKNWAKEASTLLYFQQSAGEHIMQHSTMLGMLNSHRIVNNPDGTHKIMSFDLFNRSSRENVLREILKEYDDAAGTKLLSRFETSIASLSIKGNEAEKRKYLTFKRDMVTEFLHSVPSSVKTSFGNKLKERTKTLRSEFESYDTVRSQFELRDGLARPKEGSKITYDDIAKLREKIVEVNHKIHGIYDKIGANKWQSTWHGAIAMQFHKHMIPGWGKRWGYLFGKGIYNESRETVEKGMYVSTLEFLTTPFTKRFRQGAVPGEVQSMQAYQSMMKSMIEFYGNAKTYYRMLPEYDQANIRRTISEMASIMGSLCLFIAASLALDDDDESTQVADYMIYQSDRLASELQQYMLPFGVMQEAQKLYQNPVAAMATLKQTISMGDAILQYMITGDSNKLYYMTGVNAGENKLYYNLQKQIPVWNQYMKHRTLGRSNKYYKLGNNITGFLPAKDWIEEWKQR